MAAFLLLALGIGTPGCSSRAARVQVSEEDLIKAYRYVQEGNVSYKNNDFYAALVKYLMARDLNPNSESINNHIGVAFLKLKYYEKSIEAFRQSLRLNPKYSAAVNNLGSAYFADGNYKKAEKYFKKAIKMKKDEASYHLNLGSLYLEMNKLDKAISSWRTSLSLDPDILTRHNPVNISISGDNIAIKDRYYFMARIYASTGNVPKVIENLENALLAGFTDIEMLRNSSDFDPIRKDERFVRFLESATVWSKPQ